MKRMRRLRRRNAGQQGYALVLVVFLMALLIVSLAAVATNVLVDGRRQKEEEMIWRGKQYVRGIRLFVRYYQMHGGQTKFPTSMEDLTKNKVGIRFMRQEYKDPLNTKDGSWRFIYVGPNGQLIGSLKPQNLPGVPGAGGSSGGGLASLFGGNSQAGASSGPQGSSFGNSSFGNSSFGNSSFGGSSFGGNSSANSSFGNSSFGNSSFGNSSFNNNGQAAQVNPVQPGSADAQNATDAQNTNSWSDMATPQAVADADVNRTVIGGNIIGVGGKINQKSIIWYEKAKNYRQFEFIWDPAKEPVNGGANAGVVGIPQQAPQNGSNSIFSTPGGNSGFGPQPGGGPGTGGLPGGGMRSDPGPGQGPQSPTPQ